MRKSIIIFTFSGPSFNCQLINELTNREGNKASTESLANEKLSSTEPVIPDFKIVYRSAE